MKKSLLGSSTITSLLLEARAIGLEAAIELGELRVAAERLGVDRRGLGVALALDLLRVAVGLGDDHLALAVGVGADLLALGGAGGAQLVGDVLALDVHAAVDRLGDVADEVDALDAHVEDLDAERLGVVGRGGRATSCIDLVALGREQSRTVRLVTSSLNAACTTATGGASRFLMSTPLLRMNWRGSVMRHLHEPVDHQALLLGGEDRPRLRAVERLDAAVEEGDVLERRRQLEVQARLGDHFLDLAERVDHARTGAGRRRRASTSRAASSSSRPPIDESDTVHGCAPVSGCRGRGRAGCRASGRRRLPLRRAASRRGGRRRRRRGRRGGGAAAAACCISLSSGRYSRLVAARVDHHLGDVRVDLLHRVDVEAVARDLRRLLVLGEQRA